MRRLHKRTTHRQPSLSVCIHMGTKRVHRFFLANKPTQSFVICIETEIIWSFKLFQNVAFQFHCLVHLYSISIFDNGAKAI